MVSEREIEAVKSAVLEAKDEDGDIVWCPQDWLSKESAAEIITRAALEAAARVRAEANAGGGEVDRLKRAVWRLSGSGMSYVRFWEVYSDKLDGLTKTDVRRNEAHPAPSEHALEGGE